MKIGRALCYGAICSDGFCLVECLLYQLSMIPPQISAKKNKESDQESS